MTKKENSTTTEAPTNLQELLNFVNSVFHCDSNVYWKLQYLPRDRWQNEIITHSNQHLVKSAGRLIAISEAYEHGADFDAEAAKAEVLKSFATLSKTAVMLGMTAEDILKGIPEKITNKTKKD